MDIKDRELLEMAAKAVGYNTNHSWNRSRLELDPPVIGMVVHDSVGELVSTGWSPLENDTDAFRLMLALQIDVSFWREEDSVCVSIHGNLSATAVGAIGDIELRRAIVRAAAEIGRSMP